MQTRKAILLAAGMGSRLRPFTDDRPKPMVPVGGMPLLEHSVRRLVKHGITDIGINLHYQPQVVRAHFGDGSDHGVRITYSHEPELLGTAGAVKALESFVSGERVLVHYGDNLSTCNLEALEALHLSQQAASTLALFSKEDVSPHSAVDLDDDARVTRFIEKPKPGQTDSHWISAGIMLIEPEVLAQVPAGQRSDFGFDVFPRLLASGAPLFGYRMGTNEGLWWIDTPEDYARVSGLAARGLFA